MREEIHNLRDKFELLLKDGAVYAAVVRHEEVYLELRTSTTQEERIQTSKVISEYLLRVMSKIDIESLTRDEFDMLRKIVDEHYVFVKHLTREKGIEESVILHLRAQTLALKIGGKVPVDWLKKGSHRAFWLFIVRNYYHHDFFALRLQVPFDYEKGPSIPIYRKDLGVVWIPFNRILIEKDEKKQKFVFSYSEEVLFESDFGYVLGEDYTCFYNGIQRYNIYYATNWIPYDKRDPKEWGEKYILEVWTSSLRHYKDKPSLFYRTHAYMILLDKKGYVRSVGQDALIDIKDYKVLEVLATKPGYGKIATPDRYVLYPTNSRLFQRVSFELTKEQHDKLIELVEKDKKNPLHAMSVQKKNCVSYTMKVLKEILDFEIDGSISGIHIFFKAFLPDRFYRKFMKWFMPWFEKKSPLTKKMLHFFPPYYLAYLITMLGAAAISQNNYRGIKDYRLRDILFTPWKHNVDHPLPLHRALEKHADDNGFIQIKKDRFA